MFAHAVVRQSVAQRRLMHIEQSVDDISDLFLNVYLVLDDIGLESGHSNLAMISLASWDQHYQASIYVFWLFVT